MTLFDMSNGTEKSPKRRQGTNQPERLHNITCLYCSCMITDANTTKEHVIARNFVPKGYFENAWNLIANACERCNSDKGDLEDDISAILMMPLLGHNEDRPDDVIQQGLKKSRGSLSRKTSKPIIDSEHRSEISNTFGRAKLSFGFVAPPQIDDSRVDALAEYHITALFYLLTYDAESQRGRFWTEGFEVIHSARSPDWGNPIHVGFSSSVKSWPSWFKGSLARGYFKALIRKKPDEDIFAWALEWNKTMRVIGVFGETQLTIPFIDNLPNLEFVQVSATRHYRRETPLDPKEDYLFFVQE